MQYNTEVTELCNILQSATKMTFEELKCKAGLSKSRELGQSETLK